MLYYSKKSVLLFVFVCLLPLLLLLLAEGGLRLGGYGEEYSLFVLWPDKASGEYTVNGRFYGRNFVGDLRDHVLETPLWGEVLSREKSEGIFRIFIFGGSVAMGEDPKYAFNIARFLEVMLRCTFPDINFEIHNLACFALSSTVMSDAAAQAAAFSPDMYLVYMGNNEYLNNFLMKEYDNGKIPHPRTARLLYRAQQWRLVQWIQSFTSEQEAPLLENWEDFYAKSLPLLPNSPFRESMYKNYAYNLRDMHKSARRGGATLVVSTMATNIASMPPMGSAHKTDLQEAEKQSWEEYFDQGRQLQEKEPEDALRYFDQARILDDHPAKLHFHRGQCLTALGRFSEAREAFQRGSDQDIYPLRADSKINAIIRDSVHTGRERGEDVVLADTEKAFAVAAPDGITGDEYCFDYVHLNLEGNYCVAATFFEAMKDSIVAKTQSPQQADLPCYEECCRHLGISPHFEVACLNTIVEELEQFVALHGDQLSQRYRNLHETLAKSLPPDSLDEGLKVIDEAMEFWGDDLTLCQLRCELLREAGRTEELQQEAEEILHRFGKTPWGAHVGNAFLSGQELY